MKLTLQEARDQFASAEAESDPAAKLEALEDALAIVAELLEEPDIPAREAEIARNVRRAYLRKLLQQLLRMQNVEILEWCGYVRLFLVDQKPEMESVFAEDPELRAGFEEFLGLWRAEFRGAFGKDIEKL